MLSLEIIMMDLRGIVSDFRPHHVGPFFFWAMWLATLFSSLRGVDRRDELAQLTYMAVLAALGVLFLFVFPLGRSKQYGPHEQIVLFSILLLIPSLRWIMVRKVSDLDARVQSVLKEKNKTKKGN